MELTLTGLRADTLRPPLKWAGGKRWLVPHLQRLYSAYRDRRLVEPFVGGLAVALGLRPDRALLSDVNPHLINFYHWLQRGLVVEGDLGNDADCYYAARSRFNHLVYAGPDVTGEAAGLFYYLNRTCFNGLCRFNNAGAFNVPFGRYAAITYTRDFRPYSPVLSAWEFRCTDFGSLRLDATDFIYADPPYDVEFTKYARDAFTWEDQIRLAEWLALHEGPVVASNQATPRILGLYSGLGFDVQTLHAPRRIACNGDRKPALEMVALRNLQ